MVVLRGVVGSGRAVRPSPSVSFHVGQDRKTRSSEIGRKSLRPPLGHVRGPTFSSSFNTDRAQPTGIREGLSRVSWKLSRTVLRGGAAGNGGSLLDQDTPGGKQPWYFTARDGSPALTIAGIWDEWLDLEADKSLKSCTMIITEPSKFVAEIHDRMPVLLAELDYEPWLSGKAGLELLKPAAENALQKWPVSKRVNSSRAQDDDPTLIDKVAI